MQHDISSDLICCSDEPHAALAYFFRCLRLLIGRRCYSRAALPPLRLYVTIDMMVISDSTVASDCCADPALSVWCKCTYIRLRPHAPRVAAKRVSDVMTSGADAGTQVTSKPCQLLVSPGRSPTGTFFLKRTIPYIRGHRIDLATHETCVGA